MGLILDPAAKPRLRPVEAISIPPGSMAPGSGADIALRDVSGLSDVGLTISSAALHVLALMDGTHTREDIRREFQTAFAQPLEPETLETMLEHLERAHLLEGPGFEAYYQTLVDDYRSQPIRPMRDPASLGIHDDSGEPFNTMLGTVDSTDGAGHIVGLVAPHLDYPRGAPCYAMSYGALRNRKPPDRVVILGTNHFGRSTSVVSTSSDFATPLGTTINDTAFLAELERRCGPLCKYELDHAREHSIELQVAWLQHLFGAESFRLVPLLCPDPCGPTGTAPIDGDGVDLKEFAAALRDVMIDDDGDTLIVAGADLSHVGAAFGDDPELDDTFLENVRNSDRRALDHYESGDARAFVTCVANDENPTRICSAGCMFTLATALPEAAPRVLDYHQAVDQPTQTCVTCAAIVFTQDA